MSSIPQSRTTAKPDLAAYMQLISRSIFQTLKCHDLGTIQEFDSVKQSAKVTLNYKTFVNGNITDYPVLIDCPVVVLGGGGGFLSFPIAAGDTCLIFYNDTDIDNWIHSGQVMPVNTGRAHSFSDALVLVGVNSFANPISNYDADNVTLDAGAELLNLKNQVTDLKTILNGLIDAIDVYVATGVVSSGPGAGGALSFAAGKTVFDGYKNTVGGLLK